MRRVMILIMLVVSAVSVMSVSALEETTLTDLAQYYDEDTLAYASIRTDDGYLAELDALFVRAQAFLPEDNILPADTLVGLFDVVLSEQDLGTFEQTIGSWLGNTIAIGSIISDEIDPFGQVSASGLVTIEGDGEIALAIFDELVADAVENQSIERYEQDDFVIFEDPEIAIAFGGDVIFVGLSDSFSDVSPVDAIPFDGIDNPLSDSDRFNDAIADLPADNYNALVYINTPAFNDLITILDSGLPEEIEALVTGTSPAVIGFTIIEGESLTIDVAQSIDTAVLDELGLSLGAMSPLDYSFANHIPSDAIAVLQASDFGNGVQTGLDNLRAISAYIRANGGLADLVDPNNDIGLPDEARIAVNEVDIALLIGAVNVSFAGATGLSLENAVLPVLDGDIAMYFRAGESDIEDLLPILPDVAVLWQTSDADGAAGIVEQLGISAENYDLDLDSEDYGDEMALVFETDRELGVRSSNLDILLGSSDDVIALGTRPAVEAALDTSNGLADDVAFQRAQTAFLDDAQQLAYIAVDPILDAIDEVVEAGFIDANEDFAAGYKVISLIESSSITTSYTEDGMSLTRFVITLSDEPREVSAGQ